jgi:hypothetical protein
MIENKEPTAADRKPLVSNGMFGAASLKPGTDNLGMDDRSMRMNSIWDDGDDDEEANALKEQQAMEKEKARRNKPIFSVDDDSDDEIGFVMPAKQTENKKINRFIENDSDEEDDYKPKATMQMQKQPLPGMPGLPPPNMAPPQVAKPPVQKKMNVMDDGDDSEEEPAGFGFVAPKPQQA